MSNIFRLRVNINLVNTTAQPKENMPDHLYHGNIKCCVNLIYIFDICISSNTCINVSLLDYLSVNYMTSCYCILAQSRANDLDDRRYLINALLPTGVFCVWHSCYASLKYFGYFNNDTNMLCILCLVKL